MGVGEGQTLLGLRIIEGENVCGHDNKRLCGVVGVRGA